MQTFLPYDDYVRSLSCLDNKRLGKQRVEAKQILTALSDPQYGWQHHPAVNMWRGYEALLIEYHNVAITIWTRRGFKNTMKLLPSRSDFKTPPWWGGPIHASHRSNLLRKDPEHYGQYGWKESPDMPYYWPTQQTVEIINHERR